MFIFWCICAEVLEEIAPALKNSQMLVSVVAGLPLAVLSKPLAPGSKIIRSMPNTPMLVGAGAGEPSRVASRRWRS